MFLLYNLLEFYYFNFEHTKRIHQMFLVTNIATTENNTLMDEHLLALDALKIVSEKIITFKTIEIKNCVPTNKYLPAYTIHNQKTLILFSRHLQIFGQKHKQHTLLNLHIS